MNRFTLSFLFLFVGVFIGWVYHDLFDDLFFQKNAQVVLEKIELQPIQKKTEIVFNKKKHKVASTKLLGQRLLQNPHLDELIELLLVDMSDVDKQRLKRELREYAKQVSVHVDKSNIEAKLLILAKIPSIEKEILSFLISHYEKSSRHEKTIETLFRLRRLVNFDTDYIKINKHIENLVNKHTAFLVQANQKEKLTSFFENILLIEPDNYRLQMKFAKIEFENNHYISAIKLLNVLIHHVELAEQASQLLQLSQTKLQQLSFEGVPISLVKQGSQYIVKALINDSELVRLMIDTGASMTILSPEVAYSLGFSNEGLDDSRDKIMRFSTANGHIDARVIEIDSIDIQQYRVTDLEVAIMPSFPMGEVDGLLGMNFLSQFTFFINQENNSLKLRAFEKKW